MPRAGDSAVPSPSVIFCRAFRLSKQYHGLPRTQDRQVPQAAMLAGSLGMLPSASLGTLRDDGTGPGMYEPIHGSAPDIAGQGIANPLAMLLCVAQLLRLSCGLEAEAAVVESAVAATVADGLRTPDIAGAGEATVTTREMADAVLQRIGGDA